MYDIISLDSKELSEIREIAKSMNIPKADKQDKKDLIYKILDHQALNPSEDILAKEKKEVKRGRGRPRKTDRPQKEETLSTKESLPKPKTAQEPKKVIVRK